MQKSTSLSFSSLDATSARSQTALRQGMLKPRSSRLCIVAVVLAIFKGPSSATRTPASNLCSYIPLKPISAAKSTKSGHLYPDQPLFEKRKLSLFGHSFHIKLLGSLSSGLFFILYFCLKAFYIGLKYWHL